MQRYKCHKEVMAVKILVIDLNHETGGAFIVPVGQGMDRIEVSAEYLEKHQPQEGGYLVKYDDSYLSYSPAEAFENGYTLISGHAQVEESGERTYAPPPVHGYRNLSQSDVDVMNEIKAKAEEVGVLVERLCGPLDPQRPDQRWVNIAKTQLQQGFMALVRSVAKPNSF